MHRWFAVLLLGSGLVACAAPAAPTTVPAPSVAVTGATQAPQTPMPMLPDPTDGAVALLSPTPIPPTVPVTATPQGLNQPFPLLGTPTPSLHQAFFSPQEKPLPEPISSPTDVAHLKPWRTVGFGGVRATAFAPNATELAVATGLGIVYLDSKSLDIVRVHPLTAGDLRLASGEPGEITALAFDPTGAKVTVGIGSVHGGREREWKRFAVADGAALGAGQPITAPPTEGRIIGPNQTFQVEFPPLSAPKTYGIKLRRIASDEVIYEDTVTQAIAFAPQEQFIAMIGRDDILRTIDLNTLEPNERPFERFSGAIFSTDGQYLLTIGATLAIWDIVSGDLHHAVTIAELEHTNANVMHMTHNASGELLTVVVGVIGIEGGQIQRYTFRVHSSDHYELMWTDSLQVGMSTVWDYKFNPNMHQYAVIHQNGDDSRLTWHTNGEVVTQTLEFTTTAMEFAPTGQVLAVAMANNQIALMNTDDFSTVRTIQTPAPIEMITIDPTGTILIGKTAVGPLMAWRIADGTLITELSDSPTDRILGRGKSNSLFATNAPTWVLRPSHNQLAVFDVDTQLSGTLDIPSTMVAIGPFRRLILSLDRGVVTLWGRD